MLRLLENTDNRGTGIISTGTFSSNLSMAAKMKHTQRSGASMNLRALVRAGKAKPSHIDQYAGRLDEPDCKGRTVLHEAAAKGHDSILRQLIISGGSCHCRTLAGHSVLQEAEQYYREALKAMHVLNLGQGKCRKTGKKNAASDLERAWNCVKLCADAMGIVTSVTSDVGLLRTATKLRLLGSVGLNQVLVALSEFENSGAMTVIQLVQLIAMVHRCCRRHNEENARWPPEAIQRWSDIDRVDTVGSFLMSASSALSGSASSTKDNNKFSPGAARTVANIVLKAVMTRNAHTAVAREWVRITVEAVLVEMEAWRCTLCAFPTPTPLGRSTTGSSPLQLRQELVGKGWLPDTCVQLCEEESLLSNLVEEKSLGHLLSRLKELGESLVFGVGTGPSLTPFDDEMRDVGDTIRKWRRPDELSAVQASLLDTTHRVGSECVRDPDDELLSDGSPFCLSDGMDDLRDQDQEALLFDSGICLLVTILLAAPTEALWGAGWGAEVAKASEKKSLAGKISEDSFRRLAAIQGVMDRLNGLFVLLDSALTRVEAEPGDNPGRFGVLVRGRCLCYLVLQCAERDAQDARDALTSSSRSQEPLQSNRRMALLGTLWRKLHRQCSVCSQVLYARLDALKKTCRLCSAKALTRSLLTTLCVTGCDRIGLERGDDSDSDMDPRQRFTLTSGCTKNDKSETPMRKANSLSSRMRGVFSLASRYKQSRLEPPSSVRNVAFVADAKSNESGQHQDAGPNDYFDTRNVDFKQAKLNVHPGAMSQAS